MATHHGFKDGVIDGPEIYGDDERRQSGGAGDLHQARLGIAVGRSGFMVEKAFQKMPYEQRELGALGRPNWAQRGLDIQRQDRGIRACEEALEGFRHARSA